MENNLRESGDARQLNLWSGVSMIAGMIVGSGIFSSPGVLLGYAGGPGIALLAWFLGGLLAMCGAVCYAELGSTIQTSGGEQVYLRAAYGQLASFVFSWFSVFIGKPCSIAIILIVFAEYALRLIAPSENDLGSGGRHWMQVLLAITALLVLTVINMKSSADGVRLQNASTILKSLALVSVVIVGLIAPVLGRPSHFGSSLTDNGTSASAFSLALYNSLWSYDGWNNLNFITGELLEPEKNLPRAIFIALPAVIFIYMLANVSYFIILPAETIRNSNAVGYEFGTALFGPVGGAVVVFCVMVSTFGTANASIYTCSRLTQSAAKEDFLFWSKYLAALHPKYQTPVNALAFQALLTCLFIISGSYSSLINLYSWSIWIFYALAVGALFRLPPKMSVRFRAPRALAYLFLLGSLLLILVPLFTSPSDILFALILMMIAVCMYPLKMRGRKVRHSNYGQLADGTDDIEME